MTLLCPFNWGRVSYYSGDYNFGKQTDFPVKRLILNYFTTKNIFQYL